LSKNLEIIITLALVSGFAALVVISINKPPKNKLLKTAFYLGVIAAMPILLLVCLCEWIFER
jgi:hypothetical protein